MNISDCKTIILEHKHLIGKRIKYKNGIYIVTDVLPIPSGGLQSQIFINDYESSKNWERAISKFLSSKDLLVVVRCEHEVNGNIVYLKIDEVEII